MELNNENIRKALKNSLGANVQILNENGNAYSAGRHLYHQAKHTDKSPVIATSFDEAVKFEFGDESKGGMIIFSTDINAVDGGVVQKIKNWLKTVYNRINKNRWLNQTAEKYNPSGWTVGRFLRGRYRAENGKLFDEHSLSIEMIGITSEELISMAEDICRKFDQETVLVKDYITHSIMLVNSD